MCDPVDQIAAKQIELERKEPQWIAQLEREIPERGIKIGAIKEQIYELTQQLVAMSEQVETLEFDQLAARKMLTTLRIRQESDEAGQ